MLDDLSPFLYMYQCMQLLRCSAHSLQSNRTFLMYKDQYNVIRLINSFTAWNKILTDFNQGVTIQDPSPFPLIKENTLFSPCPRVPLIGGRIFLPMRNGNSWKTENFRKSLCTRKFSMGNFFGVGTHGILTHSGVRKCIWKVGTTNVWPCFGRPKLGECDKMGSVSKIMRCLKK